MVKKFSCQCKRCQRPGFDAWVGKIPWRRKWQPAPVFLLGKSHGQRSLAGYSPRGRKVLDMTEHLSTWSSENNQFRSFYCFKLKVIGGDLKL